MAAAAVTPGTSVVPWALRAPKSSGGRSGLRRERPTTTAAAVATTAAAAKGAAAVAAVVTTAAKGGRRGGGIACARGKGVSKPFIRPPTPCHAPLRGAWPTVRQRAPAEPPGEAEGAGPGPGPSGAARAAPSRRKKRRTAVRGTPDILVRGFFKIAINTECAAKADNAGMESVGSCLPTGAASHAAGGENFGEMCGRTGVWTESFFKKKTFRKNFPDK